MLNLFIGIILKNNDLIQAILFVIVSAITSYYVFPIIIQISKFKALISKPNFRSVHVKKISNLGGLGIFLGITVVITFLGSQSQPDNLLSLLGSLILLLYMGLKDDLVGLSPKQKLIGQALAASCIIAFSDIRITSLYGLFGIENLSYLVSISLTLFIFLLIINAFNLIDGVDGLAGSIGIISSLFFGVYFYLTGSQTLMLLSFAIIGALSSFLMFNFSKKNKIFMGDTGAMIIGFLLCYQAICFLTVNQTVDTTHFLENSIVLVLSVFCFPLMDLIRVFIVRLKLKKNPLAGDKNHIHHKLLLLGLKHWQIAIISSTFSLFIITIAYIFRSLDVNILFTILTLTVLAFAILPSYLYKRNNRIRLVFRANKTKKSNIIRNISA